MQKQRSNTGLTNKKTSASADKLSATASTGSIKKAECGPHAHMNSETENRAQYKQHALPEHKLYKVKAEVVPNRPLEGVSETKSQFIERTIPARPQPRENKYVKNLNKLEGESESKEKYRAWPIPERPVKFKKTEIHVREDDREFVSTSTAAYRAHAKSAIHVPTKHIQAYVPNTNKFEGESTQVSDYKAIDIAAVRAANPNATPAHMKLSAIHDRQGTFSITNAKDKFSGESEYTDIYRARSLSATAGAAPGKRISASKYVPNPNKFEGISTQQSDFQSPSGVSKLGVKVYERVQSFKPAELIRGSNASKSAKDDRTFGTETQAGFGVKVMPVCPVVARHTRPDHKADDGHFYYAETPAAVQQTA